MSKFMHQIVKPENVYSQFRFQSSLRKYQKPPTKRVKYDPSFKHSQIRSQKSNSPFCHNHILIEKDKNVKLQNPKQILSPTHHIISQSKTIKLSKRQNSNDAGSNQQDNLQKKIYQSLLNSHRKVSKYDNSMGSCSSMEEDVYLNDFQREGEMDEQKHNEDADFGNIQIKQKSSDTHQGNYQDVSQIIRETVPQDKYINDYQLTDQQPTKEQIKDYQCQNGTQVVSQEGVESKINQSQDKQQTQKINYLLSVDTSNIQQALHKIEEMPTLHESTCNLLSNHHFEQNESNSFISVPNEFSTDKCMAFQGGRICINCPGQQYLISVRVFNRLRTQYTDLDQLIDNVIQQRPYLQSMKDKLIEELKKYYQNYD